MAILFQLSAFIHNSVFDSPQRDAAAGYEARRQRQYAIPINRHFHFAYTAKHFKRLL